MDKPKHILFEKLYNNYDYGTSKRPLYESQKQLAEAIVRLNDPTYGNLKSLISFLSHALRSNDEDGSKPLPTKLKLIILDMIQNRINLGSSRHSISKELSDSFDYWKTESDKTAKNNLIRELQNIVEPGMEIICTLPSSLSILGRFDAVFALHDFIYEQISNRVKFIFVLPGMDAVSHFWKLQESYFNLWKNPKSFTETFLYTKNQEGNIRTIEMHPTMCSMPIYCFIDESDKTKFKIVSISFDKTGDVNFMKFGENDAAVAYELYIKQITKHIDDSTITREWYYSFDTIRTKSITKSDDPVV